MPRRYSGVFAFDDASDCLDSNSEHHLIIPPSTNIRQHRASFKARQSFSQSAKDSEELLISKDYSAQETHSTRRTIYDFEVRSLLGVGSFGNVHLVKDIYTGRLFAKKTIKKAKLSVDSHTLKISRNERDILAQISHPSIVKLFYTFHDNEDINFVLEYIPGGELFYHQLNQPGNCFTESQSAFYLSQIGDALHHLHSVGIVYRDLKPENCMLDTNGHVILTDFGLSSMDEKCHSFLGTPEFMAPEVLCGEEYSYQADWWSFGVMMYDMLLGKTPFKGQNKQQVYEKIKKPIKIDSPYLSEYAKDLLRKLLNKNPDKRFAVDEQFEKFKQFRFFRNINWKDLKSNVAPIVPVITDPELAENFDIEVMQKQKEKKDKSFVQFQKREFGLGSIDENAAMEVDGVNIPTKMEKTVPDFDDSMFKGFSFTASTSVLDKHIFNRDI